MIKKQLLNISPILILIMCSSSLLLKTQAQEQKYNSQNKYQSNQQNLYEQRRESLTLLKERQNNTKIVAIIISIHSGNSYDQLFTKIQQRSKQGTQVLVYKCPSSYLPNLIKALNNQPVDNESISLIQHIRQVDNDCVVFNWQCSSGYSLKTIPEGKKLLFSFLKNIMNKGHMVMFSDFSLKALIEQWDDSSELGPNPFKQLGETDNQFQLRFNPQTLKHSPSAQLKMVGELAEGGKINVHVMPGTIIYSVNQDKVRNDFYQLQVLTVATSIRVEQAKYTCEVGEYKGAAGHVLLKYKSGGYILTSMGHWIELMKIDTSEAKLFEVAKQQYGNEYVKKMQSQYQRLDTKKKKKYIEQNAAYFIQNQAPSANMAQKKHKNGQQKKGEL